MTTPAQTQKPTTTPQGMDGRSARASSFQPRRALILLGDGGSACELDSYRRKYPDHEVWTINASIREFSTRHFEIHYDDQPENRAARAAAQSTGTPFIISPFRRPRAANEISFPLDQVFNWWGLALFERTLCYQLAMALTERAARALHFDAICLPGHDFAIFPHFAFRNGPTTWLGVAIGLGIKREIPAGSALLKRRTDLSARHAYRLAKHLEPQPHAYGQPESVTAHVAEQYGWA